MEETTMTENLKKFLETVSAQEELGKKSSAASKEELMAMAKELGLELTEADFKQKSAELSDDELEAVSGGSSCSCSISGSGKQDVDGPDDVCACNLTGLGYDIRMNIRCLCQLDGYGR